MEEPVKKHLAISTNLIAILLVLLPTGTSQPTAQEASTSTAGSSLDFQVYRTRIEPIFLKERGDGVKRYNCHSVIHTRLRLQPMSPGSSSWTEEQSRQNFEVVSHPVTPGEPQSSRLLMHPLSPDAGSDPFHDGGWQFESQSDPDWMTLAEWSAGQETGAFPTSSDGR
jgi:hypothetical protein